MTWTYYDSLMLILSPTDVTERLGRWHSKRSEFEFDVVRRACIFNSVSSALLHLSTQGKDSTTIENDVQLLAKNTTQNCTSENSILIASNNEDVIPFGGDQSEVPVDTLPTKKPFPDRIYTWQLIKYRNTTSRSGKKELKLGPVIILI